MVKTTLLFSIHLNTRNSSYSKQTISKIYYPCFILLPLPVAFLAASFFWSLIFDETFFQLALPLPSLVRFFFDFGFPPDSFAEPFSSLTACSALSSSLDWTFFFFGALFDFCFALVFLPCSSKWTFFFESALSTSSDA
jgi:hypothetical protein